MRIDTIKLCTSALDNATWPFSADNDIVLSLLDNDPLANYRIKNVTGLEPQEVGGSYLHRYVDTNFGALLPREISILLELNPINSEGKHVSDIRNDLYRLINGPNHSELSVCLWYQGFELANISGAVTRIETNPFSKDSEAIITLTCEDQIFRAPLAENVWDITTRHVGPPAGVIVDVDGVDSIIVNDTKSTAPHGLYIDIEWTGYTPGEFEMTSTYSDGTVTSFLVNQTLNAGEHLIINTNYGAISVDHVVLGVSTQVADTIEPGSVWPAIYPLNNQFGFPLRYFWIDTFTHIPAYWGV
jgi:hypothetical protein